MTDKKKPRPSKTRPENPEDKREAEGHREDKPESRSNQEKKRMAENTESTGVESTGQAKASSSEAGKPSVVRPQQSVTQYVVTVDNSTGQATKIEKLNDETGQRKELTQDEYAAIFVYAGAGLYYGAPLAAYSSPYTTPYAVPGTDALVRAYFQGVSDYLKALAGAK
jgi:hypothetical protein